MVRLVVQQFNCDLKREHRCGRKAVKTMEFSVFGVVHEVDLCQQAVVDFRADMELWTHSARRIAAAPEVERGEDDAVPELVTEELVEDVVVQRDRVWWHNPKGANSRTKRRYNATRAEIWKWGHAQPGRFPNLSPTCHGVLPEDVGHAWTEEVYYGATAEPASNGKTRQRPAAISPAFRSVEVPQA